MHVYVSSDDDDMIHVLKRKNKYMKTMLVCIDDSILILSVFHDDDDIWMD